MEETIGFNRSSRAKKNILVSLSCQIVTLLCAFVVPRVMLVAFGSELYGATSSITQFLAYITLLDGGVGSVAKSVLYKPLAEKDKKTISAILLEIRRFFRVVGIIFIGYVLVIACSFKTISNVESLDWLTSFVLVVVISISTFGQYFIGISNSVLLQAAQQSYVYHIVNLAGTVINTILTILLACFGCSIILVKLVSSIVFFLRPIALWLYVKKHYQLPKSQRTATRYLTQKWSGLGQHIAYYLHSNVDIVVLTFFTNLKIVAVYSVYNMVVKHIRDLAISFVSGMDALFGDMLVKQEWEQLHKTFGLYETLMSIMSVILFSITAVMIVPFIMLYTAGISDANYYAPMFAQLLIIAALLYCLRMPYHSMVMAAGHFKQTAVAAYGEVAINIILSILLVSQYSLVGVAIGTIVATIFRFIYYAVYLSKHIFFRKVSLFIKRILVNSLAFIVVYLLGIWMISNFKVSSYFMWIGCAVLVGLLSCVVTVGINIIFYRAECMTVLKKFYKKSE